MVATEVLHDVEKQIFGTVLKAIVDLEYRDYGIYRRH